tara:strand:- start:64 stop:477 length:414 start_codon:yes stop_codon:yes gene_type:complete
MMIYEKELYHYLILHFPIALFIVGYIFDFLHFFIKNDLFDKFGFWNLGLGIITGFIAIITGFITDNAFVGHMEKPFPIWSTHGTHMIVAVIFFYVVFLLRFFFWQTINKKYIYILHSLATIFFIHGAHIGAKLADRL